jgi:uncharacterized protein
MRRHLNKDSSLPGRLTWPSRVARRALFGAVLAAALSTVWAQSAKDNELLDGIRLDNSKVIRTGLLRGADPNAIDPQYGPMLVSAAMQKSFAALRALLESPEVKIDLANARGETALMMAALHGDLDIVKLLVAKGAEINKTGWTPLHYAATNGHLQVVKYLLENHAFVDAMSPNKTTPLMMASRQKQVQVARLLVEEGADPTQRNEAGLSAAAYFKRHGEDEQAKWFDERAREFELKYGTIDKPKISPPGFPPGTNRPQ